MKNWPAVTFDSWLEYACDEDSLLFQENDSHVFESELPPTGLPCAYNVAAIAVVLGTLPLIYHLLLMTRMWQRSEVPSQKVEDIA